MNSDNNLSIKSENNLKVAELLIEKQYYDSSVHCCYYALLQFMMAECKFMDKYSNSNKEQSSHITTLNNFLDLNSNWDKKKRKYIRGKFFQLKKARVIADYKPQFIDKETAKETFDLSRKVIKEIE